MEFRIVSGELPKLNGRAIERAVEAFVRDCRIQTDRRAFYSHTLEVIAGATFGAANNLNHFWLAHEGGEVMAYALTGIVKGIDNQLVYEMRQAWVHPKYRGKPVVKQWYQQLRQKAHECLCKRINVVSSRSPKGYLRFLGKNWKVGCVILEEDLN